MSTISWPLDKWIDNVAAAALSSKETVHATFDLARNCIERGIAGNFVECGIFGGAQSAMMARAIMEPLHYWEHNKQRECRRVHLFDSFAGIPEPGPHDTEIVTRVGYETFRDQTTCSLADVKRNMAQWGIPEELLVYHPGRWEETLPTLDPHFPIALLRIDGDLYESTKVCIEHLLPDVTPGGWIVMDDWGLSGARKAAEESSVNAGPIYWKQQPNWAERD